MTLLKLLTDATAQQRRQLLAMGVLSGAANAAILAVVNKGTAAAAAEATSGRYFLMFVIVLHVYVIAQRFIFERATTLFESLVEQLRRRLAARMRASDLLVFERHPRAELFTRLTQETQVIADQQGMIVGATQSALFVVFAMIYMATISKLALLLMAIVVGVAVALNKGREAVHAEAIGTATEGEIGFHGAVADQVDGFVELKMDRARAAAVGNYVDARAATLRDARVRMVTLFNNRQVFAQTFFFVLIGVIVFVLPRMVPSYSTVIQQLATSVMFVVGPLALIVGGLPSWARANVAVANIAALEQALEEESSPATVEVASLPRPVRTLELCDLTFRYPGPAADAFGIGPINLSVSAGEVIFIVGGNGSGKSTLLRLLIGLYVPTSGAVTADGRPVDKDVVASYRELFAAILPGFHLFRHLFGIEGVDLARLYRLLAEMHLTEKVAYRDGAFTTLDLSTGQRKRLALAVALLEDRPFLVFDEWAADQDPEYREYFYRHVIADLKAAGRGVVVVTHDDRYFAIADRVLRMEDGRLRSIDAVT